MHYGFWNFAGDHPILDFFVVCFLTWMAVEVVRCFRDVRVRWIDKDLAHTYGWPRREETKGQRLPDPPEERGVKKGGA
jgi:hypothetical protein